MAHDLLPRVLIRLARWVAILFVAASMLQGPVPIQAQAMASGSLNLAPGEQDAVRLGAKRTTSITMAAVTTPATPAQWALQFRASTTQSGYRAKLAIDSNGRVTAAITRVSSGRETTLRNATALGITARPGEVIQLEATVAAKKRVRIYLRAWLKGEPKPAVWQLSVSDASKHRYYRPGYVYLWGYLPRTSVSARLSYTVDTVRAFSYDAASKIKVVPPLETSDSTFSLAIVPDTQAETNEPQNKRFLNRVNWLVAHKGTFNIRYALHTGDMTNWGWLDPVELTRAAAAMSVVTGAGIPIAPTIGNHDTRAVGWNGIAGSSGYGGSAYMYNPECPSRLGAAECNSRILVRQTQEFNATFPVSSLPNVRGMYEAGKVDNYWSTFEVAGTRWLILTLEPWPRAGVVDWAADVVKSHPDYNVIIQTHHYLNKNGSVSKSNAGYGEKSPVYLESKIVSQYSNVKLIFSGHTGGFRYRTDKYSGNSVISFLGNDLGSSANPVRIVTIDTKTGRLVTTVYNPMVNAAIDTASASLNIAR